MPYRSLQPPPFGNRRLRMAAVAGLHLALLAALLHYTLQPSTPPESVISVSLLSPPDLQPPPPVAPKPAPKRMAEKAPQPPAQIVVAQTQAPAAETAPAAPPPEAAPPVVAPIMEAPVVQPDLKALYAENPLAYPPMSQRLHEQGLVLLTVTINTRGLVDAVKLARSSGFPRLDSAALEQVNRWKFRPSLRAGQPVTDTYTIPIRFSWSG